MNAPSLHFTPSFDLSYVAVSHFPFLTACMRTGMALATLFVTMPFVVRELIPILETMDLAEEEAARTMGASDWQVFWNVTLPNIRYGLLYGIILTNAVRVASCRHELVARYAQR